jgi:hypothetical protein
MPVARVPGQGFRPYPTQLGQLSAAVTCEAVHAAGAFKRTGTRRAEPSTTHQGGVYVLR